MKNILCTAIHSDDLIKKSVWCVGWNPTGTLIASSGDNKIIKIWKFMLNERELKLVSTIRGDQTRTIRFVSFSPCGRYLASASFDASTIIYEFQDGDFEEIHKIEGHENEVKCCVFSASGEFLATCSRDKTVWVWKVDEEGDYEVDSILQTHTADVKFVIWHPFEEIFLSGGYDCSIRFYRYDGADWITQQKIDSAHDDTVWSGSFDSCGEHFVSVGADRAIKIWKRNGKKTDVHREWSKIVDFVLEETRWPLYAVSWMPDGEMIAVGGGDKVLRLFSFDTHKSALSLCDKILLNGEINCLMWRPRSITKDNEEIPPQTVHENILAAATDDGIVYLVKYPADP